MQVDGKLISEAEVVELLDQILRVREEERIPATFFEVTTALAFAFFARRQLDAAVIEVGLGGRLDATNILTPRLSIITSIGLEHTKILGTTVEAIAREKAGIIKPGIPVVLGPKVPHDLLGGIASEIKSPVLLVPQGPYRSFDEENTAIARTALNYLRTSSPELSPPASVTDEAIARGLASLPPCRFEVLSREVGGIKVPIVLDVGHNPPALRRLFEFLRGRYGAERPIRLILGLSADKDILHCVRTVLEYVDISRLHVIQALHPRAAKPAQLVEAATQLGSPLRQGNYGYPSIKQCIDSALLQAASSRGSSTKTKEEADEVVVVCGTFFIMGDVRQALGFHEPADSTVISEVAGAQFAAAQELFTDGDQPQVRAG